MSRFNALVALAVCALFFGTLGAEHLGEAVSLQLLVASVILFLTTLIHGVVGWIRRIDYSRIRKKLVLAVVIVGALSWGVVLGLGQSSVYTGEIKTWESVKRVTGLELSTLKPELVPDLEMLIASTIPEFPGKGECLSRQVAAIRIEDLAKLSTLRADCANAHHSWTIESSETWHRIDVAIPITVYGIIILATLATRYIRPTGLYYFPLALLAACVVLIVEMPHITDPTGIETVLTGVVGVWFVVELVIPTVSRILGIFWTLSSVPGPIGGFFAWIASAGYLLIGPPIELVLLPAIVANVAVGGYMPANVALVLYWIFKIPANACSPFVRGVFFDPLWRWLQNGAYVTWGREKEY